MASAAELLIAARRQAGLSQRALGAAAGIPQASVARIERGMISPRTDTLERLLLACGMVLSARPPGGSGVDRSLIRERLAMTPAERSRLGVQEARAMAMLGRRQLHRSVR